MVRSCPRDPGEEPAGSHTGLCSQWITQLKAPGASSSTGDPRSVMFINHHQVPVNWDERVHLPWPGVRKGLGAPTSQGNSPTGAVGDGVQLMARPQCSFGMGTPHV